MMAQYLSGRVCLGLSYVLVHFALFSFATPLFDHTTFQRSKTQVSLHFSFSPGGQTHYESSIWLFLFALGGRFFPPWFLHTIPNGLEKQTDSGKENQSDKQMRARAACC